MKLRLRRVLFGASAALGLVGATLLLLPAPAGANGPTKYGWWYEANAGLPLAPPPPPQVPSDGLYVENGFNGPTAISALTFTVPSGAQLGPMTLKIAGTPTMTQAPIACALAAVSAGYRPAEGGSWKDRPSFDCKKAESVGTVDSHHTEIAFNVDPFQADGTVSVVILAGGSADQIAFEKPDASALRLTIGDTGAGPAAAVNAPAPGDSGANSNLPDQQSAPAGSQAPVIDTGAGPDLSSPAPPTAPAGQAVAAPSGGSGQAGSPGYALARPVASTGHKGWRTDLATASGSTAVLLALVAWTLGYGPLGGRVQPLSVRLRPQPGDEAVEDGSKPLA